MLPKHITHELALRYRQIFQQSGVSSEDGFSGHASENYVRYRVQGEGRLFAGLTLQRDPGEAWLPNGYAPDFTSFHVAYHLNKKLKHIVLGDFSAEFGQGLTLWSSLAFTKSADAVSIARFSRGLRHYTGTDENRFLRGAGVVLDFGQIEVSAYYSANRNDANLIEQANGAMVATSLQTSGFHRTASELQNRRSMPIRLMGVYTQWRPQRLRLGFNVVSTQFGFPLAPADRLENAMRFAGNAQLHTAIDWKYLYNRIFFFGEVASEWYSQRMAASAGVQVQAADALQWVAAYRYLAPGWFAVYNAPFSETGRDGEQGMYLGLNWQLPKRISVALFADHFRYEWLRTNLNRPGNGADYMLQLNYMPRNASTYLRFRLQKRPRTVPGIEPIRAAADAQRFSARWHIQLPITEKIGVNMRTEWVAFQHSEAYKNGLLTYVGFTWQPWAKWHIKARYALFDTDGYDAALWAYEDDVPYSFSVPAFYDIGAKWYIVLRWQVSQRFEAWLRFEDAFSQSSDAVGIAPVQRRTGVKALVRYAF